MTEEQIKALFTTGEVITEESMAALVDFLQEQKGPKGDKGDKGEPGTAGADGFPTQTQWDDLVARIEALEV